MADVTISYKNNEIATMNATGVKTLLTGDTFCEDDIVVSYTKPSAPSPTLQSKTVSPTTSQQTVTADQGYDGLSSVQVNAMPTATHPQPSVSITNSTGLVTASHTQSAGYVTAGTTSKTLQLTTKAAATITPTTSDQTISANRWLTGAQTIKGSANLIAGNIKKNVNIFGVVGTYEGGGGGGSPIVVNGVFNYGEVTFDLSGTDISSDEDLMGRAILRISSAYNERYSETLGDLYFTPTANGLTTWVAFDQLNGLLLLEGNGVSPLLFVDQYITYFDISELDYTQEVISFNGSTTATLTIFPST